MPTETVAPDADSAAGGWTTDSGGGTNLFASIDESTASDTDYIRSPTRSAVAADLIVRLKQDSTTIATWTHNSIGTSYVDAVQTLTAPQLAAITNFANLFIEFDDNAGAVYRASLGNPSSALTTPVTVSYRYKAETVSAGAYVGPGDVVASATGFWGLRAYSAASIAASRPVVSIIRDDAAPVAAGTDFVCLANGDLDVASITTFLAGHVGAVVKYYDQTGNGRHIVNGSWFSGGSFANVHVYSPASLNSKPTTVSDAADDSYGTAAALTQAQPFSNSFVVKNTQSGTYARNAIFGDFANGGQISFGHDNAVDQWYMTDNGFSAVQTFAATTNVWHAIQTAHVVGAPVVKVDGGAATTLASAGTNGLSSSLSLLSDSGRPWIGAFAELGVWGLALNSTQMTDLRANQNAYWGV